MKTALSYVDISTWGCKNPHVIITGWELKNESSDDGTVHTNNNILCYPKQNEKTVPFNTWMGEYKSTYVHSDAY